MLVLEPRHPLALKELLRAGDGVIARLNHGEGLVSIEHRQGARAPGIRLKIIAPAPIDDHAISVLERRPATELIGPEDVAPVDDVQRMSATVRPVARIQPTRMGSSQPVEIWRYSL